ncbi:Uncharacterised protein [Mycobacteroides abscessus subsp. abscessus]|nr:Uncharacterised protein [Mycobacteroides abscessus subsp. abscessus]
MTACCGQCSGSNQIIPRRTEKIQTFFTESAAVWQDINHLGGSGFLGASKRLILKSSDASRFIAW